MISDADFTVIEQVYGVLKTLSILTDGLSAEKEVTVSAILPILRHLNGSVLCQCPSDSKEMKNIIREDLNSRYSSPEVQGLLDKTSFLDPRFREKHLSDKDATVTSLKDECLQFTFELEPAEAEEPQPKKPKRKGLVAILATISEGDDDSDPSLTPEGRVDAELTAYLNFPQADVEANPLKWWKSEEARFPLLSKLSRKYLSICGTSVPSERVFSKSGFIVNDFRCALLPDNVDKLVFLACNLQND